MLTCLLKTAEELNEYQRNKDTVGTVPM